ncbi:ATP synthase subunit I [Desulfomicrobium orale]|nr:ATP synthase subunit I [Desulfomicrobium orale]
MRRKIERRLYDWGFHVPEVRGLALRQIYMLMATVPCALMGKTGLDIAVGVLLGTMNFLALGKIVQELISMQKGAVLIQLFSFYGRLVLTALAFYLLIAFTGASAIMLLLGMSTVVLNILLWGMAQFLGKTSKEA